ncbi:hypothetical protein KF707_14600, partial [Candidatus Obscuribacterales bacterium]|nr:hypothetical protein [Candidatus Obscuribacterales bacterium]
VTITADPPVAVEDVVANLSGAANGNAKSGLDLNTVVTEPVAFGFDASNGLVTRDLAVSTVDGDLFYDSTMLSAALSSNANLAVSELNTLSATTAGNGSSNAIVSDEQVESRLPISGGIEDNSYMVSYEGPVSETEATICSDAELGVAPQGIGSTAHGDRVVVKKGNVLFVPFRDTVVETPLGEVTIAAKSVALVSVSSDKLAVYDVEDCHKGSVAVKAKGGTWTLAPGRHMTITTAKGEFGQVNAIESIPHRSLTSKNFSNGVRVHSSEFSTATAIQTIKPLKAVMTSSHPQSKKVSDRLVKTTAIILTMTNGQAEFQHYFKPALTAMAK